MFQVYAFGSHKIHCGNSKFDEITWSDLLDKPVIILIFTILFILIFVGLAFVLSRLTFDKITSTIFIMAATLTAFVLSSIASVLVYGLLYL